MQIQPRPASPRVVIIGGGITGLAAAHRLLELAGGENKSLQLIVLEASAKAGGIIATQQVDQLIVESGPDSFISQKPAAIDLCRRLGIGCQIIETNQQHRTTFVLRRRRLEPLPAGFSMIAPTNIPSFLNSSLFSVSGKARMLLDLFLPARKDDEDESLASFVRRRFGREALERIAQPMIGGIYTADPELLSLKATMPRFIDLEKQYGSVIRGLQAQQAQAARVSGDAGARYSLFVSLEHGMQTLVDRLVSYIGPSNIRLNSAVSTVLPAPGGRWTVVLENEQEIIADAVIVSTQAHQCAKILGQSSVQVAAYLASIKHASSAVLNLVYRRQDIRRPLSGFGFVVPAIEKRSIVACTMSSIKYPNRAPGDRVLMRVFAGGALQPEILDMSDEGIEQAARKDLTDLMDITGDPELCLVTRHNNSMPQYHLGHQALIERVESSLEHSPGLLIAGNYMTGVGMPDCIVSGQRAAGSVIRHLDRVTASATNTR